ncbi:anti-sigma-I factor RsgI family protein [Dysosmobacter sp.]|uniref:anti-sigma-I factor RsgI family protein n=1 Tax=Dysosmobacter sp. TaxID=2591382 RepID=UPI003D8F53B1
MNYLVMEVHPAYAVVLDEEGRFLKAANLRYQVGDTVRDIVELRRPREKRPALWKPLSGVVGLAACLCIVFFGYYQPNFVPYGALRIQINPDVELTLSRTDRVLELEGLNADGQVLIEGYDYGGRDREDVTEELVERAIDLGYLSGGETVSITVTSADADWQAREEQAAREDLEERYGETIVIQIGPASEEPVTEVVIPVTPPEPEPTPEPPPEPAGPPVVPDDTDNRPGSGGVTGYQDTDYGPDADGITDYESPNDGPYVDGDTDYEDRDDDRDTDDDRWEDDGDDDDGDDDD